MTTPKLDEARLRELIKELRRPEPTYTPKSEAADGLELALDALSAEREAHQDAINQNTRWLVRMSEIREAAGVGAAPMLGDLPDAIRALRERGDRAVHHVKWLADWIEDDCGAELPYPEGEEDARAFLATQKAEGA